MQRRHWWRLLSFISVFKLTFSWTVFHHVLCSGFTRNTAEKNSEANELVFKTASTSSILIKCDLLKATIVLFYWNWTSHSKAKDWPDSLCVSPQSVHQCAIYSKVKWSTIKYSIFSQDFFNACDAVLCKDHSVSNGNAYVLVGGLNRTRSSKQLQSSLAQTLLFYFTVVLDRTQSVGTAGPWPENVLKCSSQ